MDPRELPPDLPKDAAEPCRVAAWKLLGDVARRRCDHGDRQLFCRTELEAEVARLLRRIETGGR